MMEKYVISFEGSVLLPLATGGTLPLLHIVARALIKIHSERNLLRTGMLGTYTGKNNSLKHAAIFA